MRRTKIRTGDRFGMVRVIGFRLKEFSHQQYTVAVYECDCGQIGETQSRRLRVIKSCGCKRRLISFRGESLSTAEWGRRLGTTRRTITDRIRRGWPLERALTVPVMDSPGDTDSCMMSTCRFWFGGS